MWNYWFSQFKNHMSPDFREVLASVKCTSSVPTSVGFWLTLRSNYQSFTLVNYSTFCFEESLSTCHTQKIIWVSHKNTYCRSKFRGRGKATCCCMSCVFPRISKPQIKSIQLASKLLLQLVELPKLFYTMLPCLKRDLNKMLHSYYKVPFKF